MAQQVFVFPAPRSDSTRHSSDTPSPDRLKQQQQQQQQQQGNNMRQKRFSCKFNGCSKDFSTSGHAARHARLHLNYKPFACDKCDMSFYRNDNLTQHKRSHNSTNSCPTLTRQQQQLAACLYSDRLLQNHFIQQPLFLDHTAAAASAIESDASCSLRDYSPPLSPASKTSKRKLSKTSVEFLLE
ncbi:hypothetical protein HDU81_000778 [Chytriomyces hyalinus]|nr:hypothetical protein HDU81_000778 [Chytriomyces hyalinus]